MYQKASLFLLGGGGAVWLASHSWASDRTQSAARRSRGRKKMMKRRKRRKVWKERKTDSAPRWQVNRRWKLCAELLAMAFGWGEDVLQLDNEAFKLASRGNWICASAADRRPFFLGTSGSVGEKSEKNNEKKKRRVTSTGGAYWLAAPPRRRAFWWQ